MTNNDPRTEPRDAGELDPGSYIGSQPEREAQTIPGGVKPGDERLAAYDSQPGVPGEPSDESSDRPIPV